jgi:hypothetical protein
LSVAIHKRSVSIGFSQAGPVFGGVEDVKRKTPRIIDSTAARRSCDPSRESFEVLPDVHGRADEAVNGLVLDKRLERESSTTRCGFALRVSADVYARECQHQDFIPVKRVVQKMGIFWS